MLDQVGWTDERFEIAKQMWATGKSAGQIEAELCCGLSRNAIMGKLFRAGLLGKMSDRIDRSKNKGPKRKNDGGGLKQRINAKTVKSVRVRSPSHGGTAVVESVVWEESPKPAEFLGVALIDLERHNCRFPRGEGADIRFCGQPRMDGQSYCLHCYGITHYGPRGSTPSGPRQWGVNLTRFAA